MDDIKEIKQFLEWYDWDIPDEELTPETIEGIREMLVYKKYLLLIEWNIFKDSIRKAQPFKTIMKLLRM